MRRRRMLLGVSGSRRPASPTQTPSGSWRATFPRSTSDLASNPAFQTELREFTELVFACAAACLDRFADFKRQYGLIDFADQETLVLDLLENNPEFRASITGRIKFMVVDEFQDTSPLQLQLFTKFAELVDKVVWVGDSKQAIYEFRGTDPELMKAVAAQVEKQDPASSIPGGPKNPSSTSPTRSASPCSRSWARTKSV